MDSQLYILQMNSKPDGNGAQRHSFLALGGSVSSQTQMFVIVLNLHFLKLFS